MKLASLVFILTLLPSLANAADVKVCLENIAYPPLIHGTDEVPEITPGTALEIAQLAAKRSGINLHFIRRPWARCLKMVKEGQIEALLPSIKTSERSKAFQFPNSNEEYIVTAPYHIFYPAISSHYDYLETLAASNNKGTLSPVELKYGLSAQYGYVARAELAKLGLLAKQDYDLDLALNMIAKNKLDGFVVMKSVGMHKAELLNLKRHIAVTAEPFMKEKLFLVFNRQYYKNNSEQINQFWQNINIARNEILN